MWLAEFYWIERIHWNISFKHKARINAHIPDRLAEQELANDKMLVAIETKLNTKIDALEAKLTTKIPQVPSLSDLDSDFDQQLN